MAGEIQSTGLATLSEVYSAIIPTLSVENKLPLVDNIIELAREQARPHEERSDMKKVTEVYIWLIKTARLFPNDTRFVVRSTAAILNHLGELVKFTELSDPLKVTDPPQVANHKPKEPLLQLQEQVESRRQTLPPHLAKVAEEDPAFSQPRRSAGRKRFLEDEAITGWTPLHWGASKKDHHALALLLEDDVDLDTRDLLGQTALHAACQAGKLETAALLARNGADINARARNRSTPLHYAAQNGHMSIVKLVVESGAESDALDQQE
ncbi:hypothetical protein FOBRF1_012349 [Fusarium oxysporum]